ncbi:MAG TPA: acyl carrier protein [Planctomycetes bacterium]|nr:acyl carrier protein [Planctomycetota bacterium]
MSDLLGTMQEILRDLFDDDELIVTRETTADDVGGWDSLAHINLIVALEDEFGVRFATAEISSLKDEGQNVGALLDLIERKLAKE